MRKLIFHSLACAGCLTAFTASAQTIDEARQLLYYDRLESAEKVLVKVIKEHEDEKEAYYWLTKVYQEKDSINKAKSLLHKDAGNILDAHPLNRVALGNILLAENKKPEAIAQFEEALKASRKKDEGVIKAIARAQVENDHGDATYALTLLNEIREKQLDAEALTLKGDSYRKLMQGSEAAKAYMQALIRDDHYAEAAYKLGKIYVTQQNPEMFLQYFNKAITTDPKYAAAYYELYYHYYFRDVNKAKEYLDLYIANTDPSVEQQYMQTDLMFASGKYTEAINGANTILQAEKMKAKPRLFKLLAYSYDGLSDSLKAKENLRLYFEKEADSNLVAKDFDLQAKLRHKTDEDSLAAISWERAIAVDTVVEYKVAYMQQLAQLYKTNKDKSREAHWLGKIFETKKETNNLDIYNWGLAHYAAAEFQSADSVFGLYTSKYPEQIYGYYWKARSEAQLDTTMEKGRAIADYKKVAEIGENDREKNKSLLTQAYGYLGAYEANVSKNYPAALDWFRKILELQPANADAQKFAGILEKWIRDGGPK
ncbi:tetratricopeptide repeat protein [Flavihumibacter solisilvae]|uniref:Tetratricopeptide repeat protein n=1 Tax=Flavihumibacter solisilvae TaxID=1349421 RepID=A0A0C1J0T5_9BACT|nr:tetratricopeptide repeat protein [Flavihumibacter solisilvae]KIC96384.1 hypothetical protein OI18_01125 [Flavihumibacter solisilvae]